MSDIVKRLRNHALPDPHDEREVLHAPLLIEAATAIESLRAELATLKEQNTVLTLQVEKAIYAEALTWTGDHRGAVFLALSELATKIGLNVTKDSLWDAAISAQEPK